MNNPATNIKEFRLLKETFAPDIASDLLRCDIEQFGDDCKAVLIYDGLYISEMESGEFWIIVERSEIIGTLGECEEFLFYDWYVTECLPSGFVFSTEDLTELLEGWTEYQDLPYISADELLYDIQETWPNGRMTWAAQNQCEWLQWFIDEWNKAQEAEDNKAKETSRIAATIQTHLNRA